MKLIINWIINAVILYLGSMIGLIELDSFGTAFMLALVAAIITWGIRLLVIPLKGLGCLTFGITFIIGIILSIFAVPLALHYAQNFIDGYRATCGVNLVILAVLMSVINNLVDRKRRDA